MFVTVLAWIGLGLGLAAIAWLLSWKAAGGETNRHRGRGSTEPATRRNAQGMIAHHVDGAPRP